MLSLFDASFAAYYCALNTSEVCVKFISVELFSSNVAMAS